MFDRFTDNARKSMGLARQEAQRFNHDYIGAEHILLGLILAESLAVDVLRVLKVDPKRVRREAEKLVSFGTTVVTMGQLPFTPAAKKVLEFSLEEASNFGHDHIGTEHLLLGLIREHESIAAVVLDQCEVHYNDARDQVLEQVPARAEAARTRAVVRLGTALPFFIVEDVRRATTFYEKLGFAVKYSWPEDGAATFALVGRDRAQFVLKAAPHHARREGEVWDALITVHDPDALAAEFVERGVTIHESPGDRDDGLRGFAVRDPDGYVLFFGSGR